MGQFSKNYGTFYQKNCQKALKNMVVRSGIRDPGSGKNPFRIPDPGVKKAPDPGSATLLCGLCNRYIHTSFSYKHSLRPISISSQLSAQRAEPPWVAEPRFELGPALQQASALPTEPRCCRKLLQPTVSLKSRIHVKQRFDAVLRAAVCTVSAASLTM